MQELILLKFGSGEKEMRARRRYGRKGERKQERSWFWVTTQLLDDVQNFTD